jgi:ATP-binding cassette subfamily B protein
VIRHVWRQLKPLLPAGSVLRIALLSIESFIAAVLEAVLLVLVVSVATAVIDGAHDTAPPIPGLGTRSLSNPTSLVIAGGAGLIILALHFHVAMVAARLPSGVLETSRKRVVRAFSQATWDRQARDREGAVHETVGTIAMQTANLVMHFVTFTSSAIGLGALLVIAGLVNPLATAILLVFGGLLVTTLRPIGRLTRRRSSLFVGLNSQWSERTAAWTTLAQELRVFGVAQVEAERLVEENRSSADAFARMQFASRMGSSLFRDVAILLLVAGIGVLYAIDSGQIAEVGSVFLLVVRSLNYAQISNFAMQSVNELSSNLDATRERLASLEASEERVGALDIDSIDEIRFQNVGYEYEPGRVGLDGVTFSVPAGEAIGIIGPSGGGKSTLAQVLMRLRTPTRGSVTVGGLAYESIAPECWHRLAALVPQEPKLFQGTIADNITFFRAGISKEQVEAAAAAAHVADEITRLPDGYETALGPRGAGLSGGQKQRIAVARALVGSPQLLVLDEPTSALDPHSEQLLKEAIEDLKGRVTLFIVAHRVTTLSSCDRVIALSGGRVQVMGTLAEAIAQLAFVDPSTADLSEQGPSICGEVAHE